MIVKHSKQILLFHVILTLSLLFLNSCSSQRKVIVNKTLKPSETNGFSFETLMAKGSISYETPEDYGSYRAEMYFQKPDKLRIDIMVPFFGNVARLLYVGQNISLIDFQSGKVYLPSNRKMSVLEPMIGIYIPNSLILDVLKMDIPEHDYLNQPTIEYGDFTLEYSFEDSFPPNSIKAFNSSGFGINFNFTETIIDRAIPANVFDLSVEIQLDTLYLIEK